MSYIAVGSEFTVNPQTALDQGAPNATRLANGTMVVIWQSSDAAQDGSGSGIRMQLLSATGTRIGSELRGNASGVYNQTAPQVTALSAGGYVVTWQSEDAVQDGSGFAIKARVFAADGSALGEEFRVNTFGALDQKAPSVTALGDGGFVIGWHTTDSAQDGSGWAVKAQRFDAGGVAQGSEFLVNTSASGSQNTVDLVTLADGRFLAAWQVGNSGSSNIYAQAFNADGTKSGGQVLISGYVGETEVALAALGNGGFVATYVRGGSVFAQVFSAGLFKVGGELYIGDGLYPEITTLSTGGFAMVWADAFGSYSRAYSAAGVADGVTLLLDGSVNRAGGTAIVALDNGQFASFWTGYDVGTDIQARIYKPNAAPELGNPTRSASMAEGALTVVTASASDDGGPSPVSYSIVGGVDSAKFAIAATTGFLTFKTSPNFEAPGDANADNVYEVIVRASDGELSDSQTILVTITNVNEAPVITSDGGGSSAGLTVAENGLAVNTVVAGDPDFTVATFSIVGGADAAKFAINATTGALTFVAAPNFEAPGDANGDNVYQVVVSASDGALSDTQVLSVTVSNVNEAPIITSASAFSIAENATAATVVASTDPEGTPRNYSIAGGVDAAKFTIDAASGALSFIAAPDYENTGDADADNVYQVTVRASDGSLSDTRALAITVTDVNEAPTIGSNGGGDTAAIGVTENSVAVTVVGATDPENAARVFAIAGGADAAKFIIDPISGALSFAAAPDYEVAGDANADNAYEVVVSASDGVLADTQALTVVVSNVNERPAFVSAANFVASENAVAAGLVHVADPEGDTLSYAIAGGADAAQFTIDAGTGALSFVAAPNFEAPSDADGDNVYDVIVSASDGTLGDTQALSVTVTNVNEAPIITSNGGGDAVAVSVAENATAVAGVISTDPEATARTYALAGGADAAKFAINATTGALSFVAAPNFEAPGDANGDNVYQVTVSASDGALSDTQVLSVTVTNVNEAPTIISNGGGDTAIVTGSENTSAVTTVTSTDPEGASRNYAIAGGADAAKFTIDATTGALAFVVAPNFEAPGDANGDNVYQVVVSADDGASSDTQTLAITVTDHDEAPVFTSFGGAASASVSVDENSPYAGIPGASDPEGSYVSYAIVGGADAALFTLVPGSNAVRFATAANYEAPGDANGDNLYEIVLRASDITGNVSYQTLSIQIANVDEAPVIVSDGGGFSASIGISENVTGVTSVAAVDPEGATPVYSIWGGLDAAKFAIDAVTGALRFIAAPNFEAPGDSDGDNVYVVAVAATVGSTMDLQSISITVANVNEAPQITSNGGGDAASIAVGENGTPVTTVAATDPEGSARTYTIVGGADAAKFAISATTGALSFVTAPNFEAPADSNGDNVYQVVVQASDGSLSDTQALSVTVTNVNEVPVISSNGGGDNAAISIAENGTAVTTVTSTDPEGTSRSYAITGGADAARFTVNATTGALSFVAAPNFEAPSDANGDNVYQVVVAASDGGLTDSQALSVTVANVNEAPVITSNAGGDSASVTINENLLAVTTVVSSDPDGGARTYAISGGSDAAKFSINATTGALAFVAAPNFEAPIDANGDNVYQVVVSASDGSLTDTQAIAVTVANIVDGVVLTGTTKADTLTGGAAEDTITGLGGNDTLNGAGGADFIDGGDGADTLIGGAGADRLTGGLGADTFVFQALGDSSAGLADFLTDFSTAQGDKIGLSAIDANAGLAGDQAFAWIGTSAFSGVSGQLRYYQSGGDTFVTGDVNGDGIGDFLIQIDPLVNLAATNFIL